MKTAMATYSTARLTECAWHASVSSSLLYSLLLAYASALKRLPAAHWCKALSVLDSASPVLILPLAASA